MYIYIYTAVFLSALQVFNTCVFRAYLGSRFRKKVDVKKTSGLYSLSKRMALEQACVHARYY